MDKIRLKEGTFRNFLLTLFLVTVIGMKSIDKIDLPPFPQRAQLMEQTIHIY